MTLPALVLDLFLSFLDLVLVFLPSYFLFCLLYIFTHTVDPVALSGSLRNPGPLRHNIFINHRSSTHKLRYNWPTILFIQKMSSQFQFFQKFKYDFLPFLANLGLLYLLIYCTYVFLLKSFFKVKRSQQR